MAAITGALIAGGASIAGGLLGKKSSSSSTGPLKVFRPHIRKAGAIMANQLFNRTPGRMVPALSANTRTGLNQLGQFAKTAQPLLSDPTRQGITALQTLAGNTQVPGLATDLFTKTIQGDFLKANPFQSEVVQAAMRPVTDQYRESIAPSIAARFAAAGRGGSPSEYMSAGRAEDTLARNLGEIGAQIGYQDYARERGFQNDMLGQAGNILDLQMAPANMQLQAGGILDAFRDKQNAMAIQRAQAALGAGQVQGQFNLSRANAKTNAAQQLLAALSGAGSTTTAPTGAPTTGQAIAGGLLTGLSAYGNLSQMGTQGQVDPYQVNAGNYVRPNPNLQTNNGFLVGGV